jgi:probable phosphoglycerate mutase
MIDVPISDELVTRLYLVRHGETTWNREKRMQGSLDSPLTSLGRAQAEALGSALRDAGITCVYSSDLQRAQETARFVCTATGLPLRTDVRLRERHYGIFQGMTWTEIELYHPEHFARLRARAPDYAPPGGENLLALRARVLQALTEIAEAAAGGRVAAVAHGGVVGIMYRHVQSIPLEAKRDYSLLNASINRFRYAACTWQLEAWGDVSHLEAIAESGAEPG